MIRLEIQAMTSQIEPLDKEEAQHIAFVENRITKPYFRTYSTCPLHPL